MGSVCALHRMPFAAELVRREFPPPCTQATLIAAGRALQLRIKQIKFKASRIDQLVFPVMVALRQDACAAGAQPGMGLVTAAADGQRGAAEGAEAARPFQGAGVRRRSGFPPRGTSRH